MAVQQQLDIRMHPLVRLAGELDITGSAIVRDILSEVLDSGYSTPQLDLAEVSFLDTSGFKAVMDLRDRFRGAAGDLRVVSVNPVVKRVFEAAGEASLVHGSEEYDPPAMLDRTPVTDCAAFGEDWAIGSFTVAASLKSGKIVRDRIHQMASGLPFTPDELGDIKLAVGEAVTNAIRHGAEDREGLISVRCIVSRDRFVVEVSDEGPGFDPNNL